MVRPSRRQSLALAVTCGLLALLFLGLLVLARQDQPAAIDVAASRWVQSWTHPALAWLMLAVSWPGFPPQSYLLPLVVAGAVALRGLRVEALWVLGTQVIALFNALLKLVVGRPRPSPVLVDLAAPVSGPSFPSGHVVQYVVLLGFIAFLVCLSRRSPLQRSFLLAGLGLPMLAVGVSRLYLGHHWLSDVLAGYVLSALALLPYCRAYVRWGPGGRGQRAPSAMRAESDAGEGQPGNRP